MTSQDPWLSFVPVFRKDFHCRNMVASYSKVHIEWRQCNKSQQRSYNFCVQSVMVPCIDHYHKWCLQHFLPQIQIYSFRNQ